MNLAESQEWLRTQASLADTAISAFGWRIQQSHADGSRCGSAIAIWQSLSVLLDQILRFASPRSSRCAYRRVVLMLACPPQPAGVFDSLFPTDFRPAFMPGDVQHQTHGRRERGKKSLVLLAQNSSKLHQAFRRSAVCSICRERHAKLADATMFASPDADAGGRRSMTPRRRFVGTALPQRSASPARGGRPWSPAVDSGSGHCCGDSPRFLKCLRRLMCIRCDD